MTRAREETRADVAVAVWDELEDRKPVAAYARGVHLVVVRFDDRHSVLSGRCQHRNALMADGVVRGDDLICGVHSWDYRIDTGISTYNPSEHLHRFQSEVVDGVVKIWSSELEHYRVRHGIASDGDEAPNEYDVHYTTAHDTEEEPFVGEIHRLARVAQRRPARSHDRDGRAPEAAPLLGRPAVRDRGRCYVDHRRRRCPGT